MKELNSLSHTIPDASQGGSAPHLGAPLESLHPAIVNLRDNQEQADFDGCMVKVSRQAVDETLAITNDLIRALGWFVYDPRYDVAVGGNPNAVEKMIATAKAIYVKATDSLTDGSASDRVTADAEPGTGRLANNKTPESPQ